MSDVLCLTGRMARHLRSDLSAAPRRQNPHAVVPVLVALMLVALNLRLAITSIASLISALHEAGALNDTTVVLVPAIPTAVFALAGFGSARLAIRIGIDRAVLSGMVALVAGLAVRSLGSPWVVVGGTVLATGGLAVVNVLLPAVVRGRFDGNLHAVTTVYTTMMPLGAATAAATAVPIADALGSATRGLAFWTLPALVGLVAWYTVTRRFPSGTTIRSTKTPVATGPLPRGTRRLTLYFALQALLSYVMMGWLPTIAHDAGLSQARSGLMLSITMAVGVPTTILIVPAARRAARVRIAFLAVAVAGVLGLLGLWLAATAAPELWAVLIGLGMGSFPLLLALIAGIGAHAHDSARVSALAQSAGYSLATLGPLGAGALHQWTGDWSLILAALIVLVMLQGAVGLWLSRDVPGH